MSACICVGACRTHLDIHSLRSVPIREKTVSEKAKLMSDQKGLSYFLHVFLNRLIPPPQWTPVAFIIMYIVLTILQILFQGPYV